MNKMSLTRHALPICLGVSFGVSGWLSFVAGAATVERIGVKSSGMGKEIPVAVLLPEGYLKDARRYPVVYVLHGANADPAKHLYSDVTLRLVDRHKVMAVCPYGGNTSWWLDAPVLPGSKYETFVSGELVAAIDGRYRTVADRSKRAIMGGSMGGFGACWNGFRHKDVFGAVGDIYGGLEPRATVGKWGLDRLFGNIAEHPEVWDAHSVLALASKVRNGEQQIVIALGTEDYFLSVNRRLHDLLASNKVEHLYMEVRGPDQEHSWHSTSVYRMVEPTVFRFFDGYFRMGRGTTVESDELMSADKGKDVES